MHHTLVGNRDRFPMLGIAVLAAVTISPLNTKIAGVAWVLLLLWALVVWHHRDKCRIGSSRGTLNQSSLIWLCALLIYAATQLAMTWGWHTSCCRYTSEVNSFLRLLTSAVATVILVRHLLPWRDMKHHVNCSIVAALGIGCLLSAVMGRDLPSNPIPWAGAMAFLVCVLLPHAWDERNSVPQRWLYGTGSAVGMVAVVLSQSRGAFVIMSFPVILMLLHATRSQWRSLLWAGGAGALVVAMLVSSWIAPSDPLRLRLATKEMTQALKTQDFNSSLGARVYLTQLAWRYFTDSPWGGVGAQQRLALINGAGLDLPPSQSERLAHVRTLGHVHNQYLHHAMDNGVIGLAGFLALLAGMVWISARMHAASRVTSHQMMFITLSHAVGSLTNVNLAHNYYALMWGLSVALIFLQALGDVTNEPLS